MKQTMVISLTLLLLVFLLPLLAAGQPLYEKAAPPEMEPPALPMPDSVPEAVPSPTSEQMPPREADAETRVAVQEGDTVHLLTMDEYLLGVLAAEMPASFPEEALRAQAVAARTYTLYRMAHQAGNSVHPDASVCTDPNHCKAYLNPALFGERWGDDTETYTEKLREAVSSTDGLAVLYENAPVLAVFHAVSSGQTERAADVWGQDFPYLQSVRSDGEQEAPRYYARVEMTLGEFKDTFSAAYPEAKFGNTPQGWFTNIRRSPAGGVTSLTIGEINIPGTRLRAMFALQSTNMNITATETSIIIDTYGHGHGVGLSQYGARAMALEGKDFREILQWYYQSAEVGPYPDPAEEV